ncbi:hypothetical protein MNBD_ALPHA06-117 [hydrothermal vent metagenome]|uniref:N-acetyltransferase domain-containing protein n=1 Tax=hydrothermal vent metagenome TaxID=652676 RepID=A0A3B0R3K2_9ZZZZ
MSGLGRNMADGVPTIFGTTLETERLILRPPAPEDFAAHLARNQDAITMEHLGGVLDAAISWQKFATSMGHWTLRGFGFFTVIEKASNKNVGSVGPQHPHGWPGQEVGWIIGREFWQNGYGKEAALAAVAHAFDTLGWQDVIHVIAPQNLASQALAKSLGSTHLRTIDHLAGFGKATNQIWGQSRGAG